MDQLLPSYFYSPVSSPPAIGECVVCGGRALHRHFGNTLACNSCCAFFRRTVSAKPTYACKKGKKCRLRYDMTRTMCKYCRFRRCLAAGMEITAVVSKVPKEVVDDTESPLNRVVLCRKAVFLNRFRVMSSVNNMTCLSDRLSTLQQCTMAIRAEFLVLCEFLMTSGILNFTDGDQSATCKMLASQLLYTLQIFESAMCTIRSFGHHQRRLFFLNESYVDLDEGAIELFYRRDPSILDSNYAMRHGMEFYVSFIEMSQKIAKARLDDTEQSVLTLLLLVDRCRKIISDADKSRFTSLINESLRDLHKHYEQHYADTALRLDQLVQVAQEIQRVSHIFEEHIVVLQLSGKQIFLSNTEPPQKATPANLEQMKTGFIS